ncbi:MAG: InlB B-repeat-containing protein [Bacteroidaceae bacterium]|nr:InlB B-repeat-containing protein [Bacteroidaceae bacterium]
MERIRFLFIAVAYLTGHVTAQAQGDFNPPSPDEPGAPTIYSRIVLLKNISDAGSVSGEGRYVVGNTVKVYAYVNSNYSFRNWTDTKGNVLSSSSSFGFLNTENTDTLIANYTFTPGSPSEPSEPSTTLYYRLGLKSTQGCSVSGAGRYLAGKNISVYASVESGYSFLCWTNLKGETVSTSASFSYTMPVDGDTLTANCVFNPDSPAEPTDPVLKHNVTATCSDGGYYSGNTGRYLEGTSNTLYAYANDGYEFVGWYLNGELYTNLSSFSYTIGKENLNFYAKFVFNPSSPNEPAMPALSQYSYYLMTVNGIPGDIVKYSINLVNTEVVKDMNIRLTFPVGMEIDPTDYVLSTNAVGYNVTISEAMDTISVIEEGARLWDFTLIGGETTPATQALLTFNVKIPEDMPTGDKHQIKINQISMTMADDTAVTAHTRNGRIGVYKLGDANGDDKINIMDVVGAVSLMNGSEDEDLIPEVTNTNGDENINIMDVVGIIEIMNNNDTKNEEND